MIRTLIILITAVSLFGQQSELWIKTYGGSYLDMGSCAIETTDGGFAIVGSTQETEGQNDIWLIKTDGNGDTLWTQTYSNHHTDEGQSIIQLSDAGFLISARTYTNNYASWLIRTNSAGDTLWTKMYEGNAGYRSRSITGTSDGGFAVTGDIYNNLNNDLWLMKANANGDTLWTHSYGGEGHDIGQAVVELPDGGFLVAGTIDNRGTRENDIWVLRTTSNGDTLWTQSYGGSGWDENLSMIENEDGEYVILGTSWSSEIGFGTWLIKIDTSGTILNSNILELSDDNNAEPYDIALAGDGGYILTGMKDYDNNNYDIWISKFDGEFEFVWEYTANIGYTDRGRAIRPASDGGFIIAGVTESDPLDWPETADLVLMRISSLESPKSLRAIPSDHQVALQWEPYTDAQQYYVFRDSVQPAISLIDSVLGPLPDSVYVDTGLAIGQYFYRIKAINNSGIESGYSHGVNTIVRDTLNVPIDYPTIQAALNNASEGSCILVQPGEYQENLFWPDIPLVKLVASGDSGNTVIRGNGSGSVIYVNPVNSVLDTSTVIEGFTITGGGNTQNGGGIFINDANIKLARLLISENAATSNGGGVYLMHSNSIITDSEILANTAPSGAGVFCEEADPLIRSTFIINNTASNAGGGIYSNNRSHPQFEEVTIDGNHARYGGAFYGVFQGNSEINNSIISNNVATRDGGGFYVTDSYSLNLNQTSILSNSATSSGGGILASDHSNTRIDRVIISGNNANTGGGIYSASQWGALYATNSQIINNHAQTQGGGVCLSMSIGSNIENVDILNNSSSNGGGLYIAGSARDIFLNDVNIADNTALSKGGGVYAASGAYPSMTNVTIASNSALISGGGIYISDSNTHPTIQNCNISTNYSEQGVNGIYIQGGSPTFQYCNITGNGFGMYNADNSIIVYSSDNWWGSSLGPHHPTQNAAGLADSVNAFINITPWLSEPDIQAPPIPVNNLHITNSGTDFIDLSWDDSVLGDLAGYRIYYTTTSNNYDYQESYDVGLATTYSLSNLSAGFVYKIVVTCYDTDSNESWFSQEIQATPQPAPIIGINPPILDFSTLLVGDNSSIELSITNSGTDVLAVSDILHNTENIEVSTNTFEIPVGEYITITIQLTPSYYGLSADTLVIQNNSFNNPSFQVPVQWFGDLPENPVILAVNDIPADQGGQVRVSFAGSKYDGYDGSQEIISYSVWRHLEGETWDALGMFNAVQDSIYQFVAPTLCDSSAESICWSSFKVSAHTADAGVYFYSDSLGGYSVDNIAPAIPDGLLALAIGERVQLQWNSSLDGDFQYFAIYRSTQSDFDPDTINTYLYTTIDTVFEDTEFEDDGTYFYKISAFDYSGNESGYSTQASAVIVAIDGVNQIPQEYVLRQNYPNPFNPTTTIRYGLPEDSNVSLVIYDVRGQVVQTLESEHQSAGWYDVVWNGHTTDGHTISTGIYFARLVAGDYSQVIKMLYLK
jgi:fibronectin type 3 domain-containing protein